MRLNGLNSAQLSMLSDFNADRLKREFNLKAGSPIENAVLYVYRHEASPIGRQQNKATLWREANIHTIQKLKRRIGLMNEHLKEWSGAFDFRTEALITAAIVDDYLIDANTGKREDFSPEILEEANNIWDEAMDIIKGYSPVSISSVEGNFLANFNTLHDLDIFYHLIEDQDYPELLDMVEEYFPDTRDFISPRHTIGQEIREYIADIEQEILSRRPTATIYTLPTRVSPA